MSEKYRVTDIVTKTKETDNPVLLAFQNGSLRADSSKVCFFKAKDVKRPAKEIAAVATSSALYRGYINDDANSSMINQFLAIKNKTTGKVRLIQVDQANLINDIHQQQNTREASTLGKDALFARLVMNFGGKKATRALERSQRSKVNIEIVKQQLDKTINDSVLENPDQLNKSLETESMNKIRPPYDAEAKRVSEVFRLADVIPESLLAKMNDEANAVLATETDQLPIASSYLKDQIRALKLASAPNTSSNLSQIKAFIYMDALQALLRSDERNLKYATLSNITERVETDIRCRFVEPNMPFLTKTRYTKEKAICYYLVLALLTSPDYAVDMNTLSAELSMTRLNITKFARLVFAKPVAKTDKLTLNLPSAVKIASMYTNRRKTK